MVSFYERAILPRLVDWGLDSPRLGRHRARALAEVRGEVLELGFGSGLNLPHYPAGVTRVVGVEPNATARRLADARIRAAPFPVELIGLKGEAIDAPSDTFDAVTSTFTLCTIDDVDLALDQVARVLKPDGTLHFLEHGLADDARLQKWQHRWSPCQQTLFGGCRVDRAITEIIGRRFKILEIENGYLRGPKVMTYMYRGRAVPRA